MRIHRDDCPPCQEWHWQPAPEGMSPLRGILSTSAYMSERRWQREREGLRNEVDAAHAVADDLEEANTHQAAEITRLRRELTARGLAHVAQPPTGAQ